MASKRDEDTTDLTTISTEGLLIRVYRAISASEIKTTDGIHEIDKKVDLLAQKQETTHEVIAKLATADQVSLLIQEHEITCRKSRDRIIRPSIIPNGKINKTAITIGSLLTGAGAAIGFLIKYFISL